MHLHQSYAKAPVLPSLKGVTIKRELAYLGKGAVCIKLENKIWQGDHLFSLSHLITKKEWYLKPTKIPGEELGLWRIHSLQSGNLTLSHMATLMSSRIRDPATHLPPQPLGLKPANLKTGTNSTHWLSLPWGGTNAPLDGACMESSPPKVRVSTSSLFGVYCFQIKYVWMPMWGNSSL